MRFGFAVGWLLTSWAVAACLAEEPPRVGHPPDLLGVDVWAVLREAGELALKQGRQEHFWTQRVLLQIGDVQIRAGDFDGALQSIRGSNYQHDSDAKLVELAEAIARDGQRERAFDVLRLLDPGHGWRQDYLEDGVQLCWIEHLIASGDRAVAAKAVDQLRSEHYRPNALRKLAVASAKAGEASRASEYFILAFSAAAKVKDDFDRVQALWKITEAQFEVGQIEEAKASIRRFVGTADVAEPWVRIRSLLEFAALAVKAEDRRTADHLFNRAIAAQKMVDALNKIGALEQIAVAQAGVGHLDDALKTAAMIAHDMKEPGENGGRDRALLAVATAKLKLNDVEGTIRTALSIEHYLQYREDAFQAIVDHQIDKGDLKAALTVAEKIDNRSRKATAMLTVAIAHAKSGNGKSAADIASHVELVERDRLLLVLGEVQRFDYRHPRTWGVCYEAGSAFTMSSYRYARRLAAEVAAAAMTLAQVLELQPAQPYEVLFDGINAEEVTQALARAHAASGDAREALEWAKQSGSSDKVEAQDDQNTRWSVERRIHALVGVAEGVLDRAADAPVQQPGP